MQTNNSSNTSNQVKPDEFRVGDMVWCLIYGAGEVIHVSSGSDYPVEVVFEGNFDNQEYTKDGRYYKSASRTLFFSEPKVEASVTRPFVPTLIGKKVLIISRFDDKLRVVTITHEDIDKIYVNAEGNYWTKKDIKAVYEVSSENLLKP